MDNYNGIKIFTFSILAIGLGGLIYSHFAKKPSYTL
jgi:hypothetical protein